MQEFEVPTELQFREESTQRMLLELFQDEDWEGLMAAAELLNSLWHQQAAISRWMVNEAAENIGQAWAGARFSNRSEYVQQL
jgi:hypothetical protein